MSGTKPHYDIYVFHRSYFCGKMLAYLKYKEIPHTPIYKSLGEVGKDIYSNTGLRQMPVVRSSDGVWMNDTTPMIEWFENKYSKVPVIPEDPVMAFLTRLMEDYADEWMWRPAIYYRWLRPEDRYMYKSLFAKEFIGGVWAKAAPLTWVGGHLIHKHQNDKFLFGDGITKNNQEHVESVYLNTLDRLEEIFERQPFLMGGRPGFADFGFFGSMFWHFGNDPTPNRIMQNRAPGVYEWIGRMWNAKSSKLKEDAVIEDVQVLVKSWESLLADVCQNYLPYLERNAEAYRDRDKVFDWNVEGYDYPKIHTSPYRVWCRERLYDFYMQMSEEQQCKLKTLLHDLGGIEALLSSPEICSDWDPEGMAPRCKPGKISLAYKLMAPFTGSNHVQTRRAWD